MTMKIETRRFEHLARSNASVIPHFLRSVAGFMVFLFFIGCSLIVTAYAQTEEGSKEAQFESQLEELLTTVYCYCGCERETIKVCVCQTAEMIEANFRGQLRAGQTVEQIRTNYLDVYGPQFHAVMPAEGINLIAYTMPVVILVLIGGVAFAVLRRARQQTAATDGPSAPEQQTADDTVKQVEAELERYKRQH